MQPPAPLPFPPKGGSSNVVAMFSYLVETLMEPTGGLFGSWWLCYGWPFRLGEWFGCVAVALMPLVCLGVGVGEAGEGHSSHLYFNLFPMNGHLPSSLLCIGSG